VLERAIRDAAALNPLAAQHPRYVSVNVAGRQLRHHRFVDKVRGFLAAHKIDPALLVIEITEDTFVADDARVWAFVAELRDLGVRVAIDDFGTGHASVSYLRQPHIDIVKIDQSFVAGLFAPRGHVLFTAMTWACHQLHLDQVAEGIEDIATRDKLVSLGCQYGQGFLYAPAMSIDRAVNQHRIDVPAESTRPEQRPGRMSMNPPGSLP
jgi:EAL domain-containing protein (putative c-di-GMP-specific phosphodiesterase class I)